VNLAFARGWAIRPEFAGWVSDKGEA
jgi:hypothetical protein